VRHLGLAVCALHLRLHRGGQGLEGGAG